MQLLNRAIQLSWEGAIGSYPKERRCLYGCLSSWFRGPGSYGCNGQAPCGPIREEVEHQPPCLPKSLSTAKLAPGFAQSPWMVGDSARLQETEAFFRKRQKRVRQREALLAPACNELIMNPLISSAPWLPLLPNPQLSREQVII